jgi:hypothetical protein
LVLRKAARLNLIMQPAAPQRGNLRASRTPSTPEFDLLLQCCSAGTNLAGVQSFSSSVNGEKFLHLAEHHAVIPQAHEWLSKNSYLLPADQFDQLRTRFVESARRSLWLTGELVRVVDYLQAAGIEVLTYKGPALAQMLYGSVTLRDFGDIDLIVRPADVPTSINLIEELGYKAEFPKGAARQRQYLSRGYEAVFGSEYGRNVVELQWQVLPRFYAIGFDVNIMFDRATTIEIASRTIRTLGAEDLFLVLCIHAAKHRWERLSWLHDIALLSRSSNLDWDHISREASRLGISRILTVTSYLCDDLLGAALPVPREPGMADAAAVQIAEHVIADLIAGTSNDFTSYNYFRTMLQARERWSDRARFLVLLAMSQSTPAVSSRSRSAFRRLYPIARPVRIAQKLIASARRTGTLRRSAKTPVTS